MDTNGLRENFQNQLKEIDEKIAQINGELEKAKEYKLKLIGGLETLELLMKQQEEELQKLQMPTERQGEEHDNVPLANDLELPENNIMPDNE